MKKFIATLALIQRWQNGVLLMLTIGMVTTPAMAILSDKAGQIQGQVPSVTGNLQVLFPDGETLLPDNTMLELNQIPNQFRVSSSTEGLVLQDADGDTGLAALVDIEHAILSWKYNGTALNPAQLAAPFRDNFAGQTLTLEISAPVTASSTTGLPTTAEPKHLTSRYTLTVASEFTGISANGHTFGMAEGFPSTGFTGATFTLNMSGAASDYAWTSSASWSSVDSNGQVTFTTQGNSSPVTITATPTTGGTPLTYSFTVRNWFINNGTEQMSWDQASTWCSNQQHKLPSTAAVTLGSRLRSGGSLWSEWGDMSKYSGSGFNGTYYSTAEVSGNSTYWVNLRDGSSSSSVNATTYVICQPGVSDAVNIDKSSLAVSPTSIVANGTATSTLTFTARDVNNNPLTGRTVTFTTSGTGATGVKLGSVTESNSVYTATLTAGTAVGPVNVAVQVDGTTVSGTNNSKTVTLTPPPVDGTRSQLSVSPTSIVANGTATSTLTFTARDVNNNPLTGRTVTFTTSGTGA
ncbi:Ig-like domain-containing protein, partial [Serratia fonticola]|uniref:Ig-like domain-containing protein n=1 Tax=Serratia fonticola TaxID=47917 RepID=UPI00192D06F2